MANTVSDDSAEDTGAAYTADDTEFNIFNTDRQLTALETAVKMLSSLPEKKALVYFSSGIQRSGMDNDAQLRATINAAIRSNVTVYTIDARGLVATAPSGNANRGSGGNSSGPGNAGNFGRRFHARHGGQHPGHRRIPSSPWRRTPEARPSWITTISPWASVQAQKDISSYYILGYYTTNAALDGKFRRSRCRSART